MRSEPQFFWKPRQWRFRKCVHITDRWLATIAFSKNVHYMDDQEKSFSAALRIAGVSCILTTIELARGHRSLESPIECLCHVHPLHLCPGGPWATSMTLGAPLRPKKRAQIPPKQPDFLTPGSRLWYTLVWCFSQPPSHPPPVVLTFSYSFHHIGCFYHSPKWGSYFQAWLSFRHRSKSLS